MVKSGIMTFLKLNFALKATNPQNKRDLNQGVLHFCPNLVVLVSIGGDLSRGQAQHGVNFDFKFNLTLKVKVNRPKTTRTLTKLFFTSGPHLVTLTSSWTSSENLFSAAMK